MLKRSGNSLEGKTVIELGSGCVLHKVDLSHTLNNIVRTGLAGIVAAMLGGSVVVTDQACVLWDLHLSFVY
jgi:hypothetical protein